MGRLQAFGMLLILWHGLCLTPGLEEFVYDRPAPLVATLCSTVLVLGWLCVAAWAGSRRAGAFVWFASIVWGISIAVILAAMATAVSPSESVLSWHGLMLNLYLLTASPLSGLSFLLPIADPFLGPAIVAALILALSLLTYVIARRRNAGISRGGSAA